MKGNDVLFGEGQDDDLIGGYGDDWISGGTGDDGVLGDDGRISTSRNSSTAGRATARCTVHRQRHARASASRSTASSRCSPTDPDTRTTQRQRPQRVHLHAGPHPDGDDQRRRRAEEDGQPDAVQRRPAGDLDPLFRPTRRLRRHHLRRPRQRLPARRLGRRRDLRRRGAASSYVQLYADDCLQDGRSTPASSASSGIDYGHPCNPGDVLRFNPDDRRLALRPHRGRAGEFALYDEYDPRRAILFNADGTIWTAARRPRRAGTPASAAGGTRPSPTSSSSTSSSNEGQVINGCVRRRPNGSTCIAHADAPRATATTCSSATSATTGSSAAPAATRSGAAGATTC